MNPVFVFLMAVALFAAYIIGRSEGYEDCIKHEESKKGIQQYSRMPWNERF